MALTTEMAEMKEEMLSKMDADRKEMMVEKR
jgi:hypothetical protein